MVMKYEKEECAGCVYASKVLNDCILRIDVRDNYCRTTPEFEKASKLKVIPRNVKKEYHHCDVCGIDFEGEPGEHINAEHYDDIHSSESMTRFEETHISEVD